MEYLLGVCFMADPWSQSNNERKDMNFVDANLQLSGEIIFAFSC